MTTRRALLVNQEPDHRQETESALVQASCSIVAVAQVSDDLPALVMATHPEIVIARLAAPSTALFENLKRAFESRPCPMVVFTDRSSTCFVRASVRSGISAYVVNGFSTGRIGHILEVAQTRFQELHTLRHELGETREALAQRKVIDRAKGILMDTRGLTESEAYNALRSTAMKQNMKLSDVASNLVAMSELLGAGARSCEL